MKFILLLLAASCVAGCAKGDNNVSEPTNDSNNGVLVSDTILYRQRLYAPGDYGSMNWRIPALLALPDGTLLAVNDKRKYNEGDLPEDIDIVARRSSDNGRTWSSPVAIAVGQGRKHGYGDAALVTTQSGEVVCAFVGGNGLWASTQADPIRSYVSRSQDGGKSWSSPEDITSQLWGSGAVNAVCRNYKASFFGSGNGLRLTRGPHAGRIMFAAAMCRKNAQVLDNFVVFSDDDGHTWQVSERAFESGDEAKLMELTDGRVLISVRRSGARGYNISTDGGSSWGEQGYWPEMTTNACNGDLLRLSAKDRGNERDVLLHSLPNSMDRKDVSLFVSYDEGAHWQYLMRLCDGPSVYSSLTLLKNGDVGAYVEENPAGACELWFLQVHVNK